MVKLYQRLTGGELENHARQYTKLDPTIDLKQEKFKLASYRKASVSQKAGSDYSKTIVADSTEAAVGGVGREILAEEAPDPPFGAMTAEKLLVARRRNSWRNQSTNTIQNSTIGKHTTPTPGNKSKRDIDNGQGKGWRRRGSHPLTQVRVPTITVHGSEYDENNSAHEAFRGRLRGGLKSTSGTASQTPRLDLPLLSARSAAAVSIESTGAGVVQRPATHR